MLNHLRLDDAEVRAADLGRIRVGGHEGGNEVALRGDAHRKVVTVVRRGKWCAGAGEQLRIEKKNGPMPPEPGGGL